MDKWARFLNHEKLNPKKMHPDDLMELVELCEELAKKGSPKYTPYVQRIVTRKLIVETALDLGIDLAGIKDARTGRYLIGRGLLDVWLVAYKSRYGSTFGTQAEWEAKRRNVKIRLSKIRKSEIGKSDLPLNLTPPQETPCSTELQ
jgi:hypothetical protein